MKFVAGFILAAAISAAIVYVFLQGIKAGVSSCPKCQSCDEGVEFSAPYSTDARR